MNKEKDRDTLLAEGFAEVINRCCAENESDTPNFILAEYLVGCLHAFNKYVIRRDGWYNVHLEPANKYFYGEQIKEKEK